ncbi:MAG: hypothetical protein ACXWW7_06500 [Nocardioides sp.]
MRRTLLVGGVLAVSAFLVVVLSNLFDLELDSVTLLGVAVGAVVALVPDRSPWMRLAGFVAGIVVAWIGFFIRAALLPDTATGRAVTVGLVVLVCALIAAASMERLPLWSLLVGAAAMSGAYEYTYAAAPPEVATTSVSTVTALLVASAVGFLVVALTASRGDIPSPAPRERTHRQDDDDANHTLDDMMEKSQ